MTLKLYMYLSSRVFKLKFRGVPELGDAPAPTPGVFSAFDAFVTRSTLQSGYNRHVTRRARSVLLSKSAAEETGNLIVFRDTRLPVAGATEGSWFSVDRIGYIVVKIGFRARWRSVHCTVGIKMTDETRYP